MKNFKYYFDDADNNDDDYDDCNDDDYDDDR